MPTLDEILSRFDLRELEEAVEKRRRREESKLSRLVARRKRLERELKKAERELERAAARSARSGELPRKPNARRLNDVSLADALEKVFRSRKKPVHYKDLTQTVVRRGLYKTRSKNLLSTVAVTLKRDKRFKKVEPGVYALR